MRTWQFFVVTLVLLKPHLYADNSGMVKRIKSRKKLGVKRQVPRAQDATLLPGLVLDETFEIVFVEDLHDREKNLPARAIPRFMDSDGTHSHD